MGLSEPQGRSDAPSEANVPFGPRPRRTERGLRSVRPVERVGALYVVQQAVSSSPS